MGKNLAPLPRDGRKNRSAPTASHATDPARRDAAHLRAMMRPYQTAHSSVVAFYLRDGTPHFLSAGRDAPQDQSQPEAQPDDLIFEIGSITKVFTAILLCVMIEEGKVDPRAPLRDMAPELANVPSWITPERLVSHTSGLPSLHTPYWHALTRPLADGPYSNLSREVLLEWVGTWRGTGPTRRPVYSNLGMGLLGDAVAMAARTSFIDLLRTEILAPMGLRDTAEHLNQAQLRRFMPPRSVGGNPVAPWRFQAVTGAGGLRSSARDLARFSARILQAVNAPETALDRAICRSVQPIVPVGRPRANPAVMQCAGWRSITYGQGHPGFLFHNGATAGSSCALYICPARNAALAILCNAGIAGHLWAGAKLEWSNPLKQAHTLFNPV